MRGSLFCDLVTEATCTEQFPILGVHLAVQANQLQAEACIDEVLLLPPTSGVVRQACPPKK